MVENRRRWQNVIDKKCPDCDQEFLEQNRFFTCQTEGCNFKISYSALIKVLTDPNHVALRFASPQQKEKLYDSLKSLGVEDPQGFLKKPISKSEEELDKGMKHIIDDLKK